MDNRELDNGRGAVEEGTEVDVGLVSTGDLLRDGRALISRGDHRVHVRLHEEMYRFRVGDWMFLESVATAEGFGDLEAAALKHGLTPEKVNRIMNQEQARRYLEERLGQRVTRLKWNENHWFDICDKVISGDMKMGKVQADVLKEVGARVAPKVERVQHEFEDTEFVFMAKKRDKDDG